MQESDSCNRYRRCRQYRTCNDCARLRQAHVADLAEQLFADYQAVYQSRFTPYDNSYRGIARVKAAIKRQLDANDALWSVEVGSEKGLLHLNIISPKEVFKQIKNTEYWQGQQVLNLRQLAAYMVKPDQIPSLAAYPGRQYGALKSLRDLFSAKDQSPIIQAAYAEKITLAGWPLPSPYVERQKAIEDMRKSKSDYEQIADNHLQKLRAFVALNKGRV